MITNVITITTKITAHWLQFVKWSVQRAAIWAISTKLWPPAVLWLHKLPSPARIDICNVFGNCTNRALLLVPTVKTVPFRGTPNFWLNHIWISSNFASASVSVSVSVQVFPSLKLHKHLHAGGTLPAAVGCSQLWLWKRAKTERGGLGANRIEFTSSGGASPRTCYQVCTNPNKPKSGKLAN